MKRTLMLALFTGGLMFASADDASAQDYRRGGYGGSGFGISLNYGAPAGYGNSVGCNHGYATPYRSQSAIRVSPQRYNIRSNYSGPAYGGYGVRGNGYGAPGYGYGGGYGVPRNGYGGGYGGYGCR